MRKIRKIERTSSPIIQKKKVAAYCRVSLDSEKLNHSFSAQTSYYNSLISNNPDWEFAGVYGDQGVTGTLISKRKGFQQMVKDALDGKIDVILAKSITRFARNTVELLDTVRTLKKHGVEVRFEKEHISTMTGDGELMLTILASFAQEESRSTSDNIKWSHRKKMQKGIPHCNFRIYGYHWIEDKLVPDPEEAEVVKRIYREAIQESSYNTIAEGLNRDGITTRGGHEWCTSSVDYVLKNCTYTGDLLLQKEYRYDPINKKKMKNNGELPQYLIEDHHEAIISKEDFEKVQSRELNGTMPLISRKTRDDYVPYKKILKCGCCGSHLRINKTYGNNHVAHYTAICPNARLHKDSDCADVKVNKKIIDAVCSVSMQIPGLSGEDLSRHFKEVIINPDKTVELERHDGSVETIDCSSITCRYLYKYLEENLHVKNS